MPSSAAQGEETAVPSLVRVEDLHKRYGDHEVLKGVNLDVATGEIDNQETLHTVRNSWLALQIRSMPDWQPCDVDASTLRTWLADCRQ